MLVGITGAAGAGKDTVGDYLCARYNFARTSFAWPIKAMINALLGSYSGDWEDREWKEAPILLGKSPRYLAQTLGTEWGRQSVGEDIWIELAMETAKDWENLVITDVRFDNEAIAIKERGGHIVGVYRNSDMTQLLEHSSESGVTPYLIDYAIHNNEGFPELYEQVEKVHRWLSSQSP